MKHLIWKLSFIILIFTACKPTDNINKEESLKKLASMKVDSSSIGQSFYKMFKGLIHKKDTKDSIIIQLSSNGLKIVGNMFNVTTKKTNTLYGIVDKNNNIDAILYEPNLEEKDKIKFIIENDKLLGVAKSADKDLYLLTEKYDGEFAFQGFSDHQIINMPDCKDKENCPKAELSLNFLQPNAFSNKEQLQYLQDTLNYLCFTSFDVKNLVKDAKVNFDSALANYKNDFTSHFKNKKVSKDSLLDWRREQSMYITYNQSGIACFQFELIIHDNEQFYENLIFFIFDTKTKSRLLKENIIKTDKIDKIEQLLATKYTEKTKETIKGGKLLMNDNIFLTPGGIGFWYNRGEIDPNTPIVLFLNASEIEDCLTLPLFSVQKPS